MAVIATSVLSWLRPTGVVLAILAGWSLGGAEAASARATLWSVTLVVTGLPVVFATLRGIWHGRFAADITASLAIVGALVLGEPLAGLVIVLMQTGGEALEAWASRRASHAVRALEARAPRQVHRIAGGGAIEDLPASEARTGDVLLIRPGEIVPCDGVVVSGSAQLDCASLTGEPMPVSVDAGATVRSGSQNLASPFQLRVTAAAAASEYAKIVDLVRNATASKAPMQRLADRYAVWFTPVTVAFCLVAYAVSGDPSRALAVLVVATPCPLLLAAPVAIVGGINRAAARGVVFRHGGALEAMAGITLVATDKTGTLTVGRPAVAGLFVAPGIDAETMLRLAASLEQGSGHLLAATLVAEALARGVSLTAATDVLEVPGQGIQGVVSGRHVAIGSPAWIARLFPEAARALAMLRPSPAGGELVAHVVIDAGAGGVVRYADQMRPGIGELFMALRGRGVRRTILLSGDSTTNAEAVAGEAGIEAAYGNLGPIDKARHIEGLRKGGERVLMLGDGLNDAPALTSATVGVALASGSGGITAEAADVVILADDPGRLVSAIDISRRTMRIARQSIVVGLGLSAIGMLFAAAGFLSPVAGAVAQEVVDLAVILNALRAAFGDR